MSDNIDPMIEKQEPEPQVDTQVDVVMQSYPSPTVDGQDSTPFYHTSPRQDQQAPTELSHPHEDQQQLDEPPTPRQAGRTIITSAEELQLAAQLSQGLAHGLPMMDPADEANLQHVIAQHALDQHDPDLQQRDQLNHEHEQLPQDGLPQHHDGLQPAPDHMHEQIHDPMHDADQALHQPQPEQQLQHHELQQHGLQQHELQQHELQQHDLHQHELQPHELQPHELQQHEQQPQQIQQSQESPSQQFQQQPQDASQHQYIPDAHSQHQQPHLQPAGPLDHMAQQFQLADNTPPRKRSKVSRACDECRRKKVKCDAPSETGEEPCSNCRRSNMRCLFSRIPQKRGPSKGYIKELADRINSIEGKLATGTGEVNADSLSDLLNGSSRRDSNELFPSTDSSGRKRPYSGISGGDFGTPSASRPMTTFGSESRPIQPYQTPADRYRTPYSANGLAPAPIAARPESETPSRPTAVMDGMSLDDLDQIGQEHEVDETAFAAYLTVVHPCFPVLAANRSRLDGQLAQCAPLLRDAFIDALHGTVQSLPSFNVDGSFRDVLASAARMIADWETDTSPRSHTINLIHLQTLILLTISTDNYGPASLKGEHGAAPKATTLGRAIGLAYSMRLHTCQVDSNIDIGLDPDSDDNVAARAWWSLVLLDRWNAISTASPLLIPNDSVVILPGLLSLLGEDAYQLIRLSNILGHFSPVALAPPKVMTFESGAAPILSSFFNLSLELFREVLPATITPATHPLLHLVYWHARLLAYLFQSNASSTDIMWPCKESVNLLIANHQLLNPLNHHFFCLTSLALLELTKVESLCEEATALLRELHDSSVASSNWDTAIREKIAEHIRPSTAQASMEATASQSLQHLADLATATELDGPAKPKKAEPATLRTSDNYENVGFDPRVLTRVGYLNALVEPKFPLAK